MIQQITLVVTAKVYIVSDTIQVKIARNAKLGAKADDRSSIPGTHKVGEKLLQQAVLWLASTHVHNQFLGSISNRV